MQFEWSKDYSVDIPQLDAQHRQIFELLGELRTCAQSGENDKLVAAAFDRVNRYAEWHLQREELLLRARDYPRYAEHKAEHQLYREKIAALQAHAGGRNFGFRIANFLGDWWSHHILTTDQQYARFFRHHSAVR